VREFWHKQRRKALRRVFYTPVLQHLTFIYLIFRTLNYFWPYFFFFFEITALKFGLGFHIGLPNESSLHKEVVRLIPDTDPGGRGFDFPMCYPKEVDSNLRSPYYALEGHSFACEIISFPPRLNRLIPSSGLLRGVRWLETDVSWLSVGPIFK
jgi:hypothetical protein